MECAGCETRPGRPHNGRRRPAWSSQVSERKAECASRQRAGTSAAARGHARRVRRDRPKAGGEWKTTRRSTRDPSGSAADILQILARFEADRPPGWNPDLLAGPRVAADAPLA